MGRTGREGLKATLSGANPQDNGDDEEIGGQDKYNGDDDIGSQEEKQHRLKALFLATGQLHQGWDITEKVINYIVTAEIQGKGVFGDDDRVNETTQI